MSLRSREDSECAVIEVGTGTWVPSSRSPRPPPQALDHRMNFIPKVNILILKYTERLRQRRRLSSSSSNPPIVDLTHTAINLIDDGRPPPC